MALRVKIATRAANQIRKASEWWSVNRPSAPNAIATDFGEAVALLAEQPGIGAKYKGSRTVGVRRLFLSRVGYAGIGVIGSVIGGLVGTGLGAYISGCIQKSFYPDNENHELFLNNQDKMVEMLYERILTTTRL